MNIYKNLHSYFCFSVAARQNWIHSHQDGHRKDLQHRKRKLNIFEGDMRISVLEAMIKKGEKEKWKVDLLEIRTLLLSFIWTRYGLCLAFSMYDVRPNQEAVFRCYYSIKNVLFCKWGWLFLGKMHFLEKDGTWIHSTSYMK